MKESAEKMAITPSSRKQKGRLFQQYVAKKIIEYFPSLVADDVVSRGMGGQGEDIMLSPAARKVLPISIEVKNQQALNIWASWAQAKANAKDYAPVLIFKRNNHEPLVCLTLDYFLELESNQKAK
jgi:hypothetical protein